MSSFRESSMSAGRSYDLLEELGRGGQAEVWVARLSGASGFSKLFAIKRLLVVAKELRAQFEQHLKWEAFIVGRLPHPNIVQVLDFFIDSLERYNIAMEYVDGPNLRRFWKMSPGPIDIPVAVYIICEVLKGLGHAHDAKYREQEMNLIHRDISGGNILLALTGAVKLADFGIAKATLMGRHQTGTGALFGKISYLPKEAFDDFKSLDRRCDIYALGIVLWELLTKKQAFGPHFDSIEAIKAGAVEPVQNINPNVPNGLAEVIARMIHVNRDKRPDNCLEIRKRLMELCPEASVADEQLRQTLANMIPKPRSYTNPVPEDPYTKKLTFLPRQQSAPTTIKEGATQDVGENPKLDEIPSALEGAIPEYIENKPTTVNELAQSIPRQRAFEPSAPTPVLVAQRFIPLEFRASEMPPAFVRTVPLPAVQPPKSDSGLFVRIAAVIFIAVFSGAIAVFVYSHYIKTPLAVVTAGKPETVPVTTPTTVATTAQDAPSKNLPATKFTEKKPDLAPPKVARKKPATKRPIPIGMGAIHIVAAHGGDQVRVSINGLNLGKAPVHYELDPGTYRVELENITTGKRASLEAHVAADHQVKYEF